MSGLNFVKTNSDIDSMLKSSKSDDGDLKNNSDVMDRGNSNVDRNALLPPHPNAARQYYRKLFSENNSQDLSGNNQVASSNVPMMASTHGIVPYYSMPQTFPTMIMMPPQQQPSQSFGIASFISDSILSLIKYIIFFLFSIGIFKFGKKQFLKYFIRRSDVLKMKREESLRDESMLVSQPIESVTSSSVDKNPSLEAIAVQQELREMKQYISEMKNKITDIPSNNSLASVLLKQIEMQQEQQKSLLNQYLNNRNDNGKLPSDMQREISDLRNEMAQLKGMIMMTPQVTRSYQAPVYISPQPTFDAVPQTVQQPVVSVKQSRKEDTLQQNYTSSTSIKRKESPVYSEPENEQPFLFTNTKGSNETKDYESGISKRSVYVPPASTPSPPTSSTPITIETYVAESKKEEEQSPVKSPEESTTQGNSATVEESFEPISEEEYNQVYDEYLSNLGKRFEDHVNFHTFTEVEPKTNEQKVTENSTETQEENQQPVPTEETPSAENLKSINDSLFKESSDAFDDILKTPAISFDELFVKAAPKTSTPSIETTQPQPVQTFPVSSTVIQEAARDLRKTQLTTKQKKSKIFGSLLAPEKKKKKKKKPEEENKQESQVPQQELTPPESTIPTEQAEKPAANTGDEQLGTHSELFSKFDSYNFDEDERFQRMLSLSSDDDECPADKTNPNFLLIQKGIYFKQLLGNDNFDLKDYCNSKGIKLELETNGETLE